MDKKSRCISIETFTMNIHSTKTNRQRIHVDMTPMVDLGFLLITFFIFTTHLAEPTVLKLMMPKDDGDPTPVKCSASLTLLLDNHDRIGWYVCKNDQPSAIQFTNLDAANGLREIIIQKQKAVGQLMRDASDLMVIIKPLDDADYRTLIEVLDEMTINGVTRYAITDPVPADYKLLADSR
jgi:biopolymer transport protein ExbD